MTFLSGIMAVVFIIVVGTELMRFNFVNTTGYVRLSIIVRFITFMVFVQPLFANDLKIINIILPIIILLGLLSEFSKLNSLTKYR